MSTNTKQLIIIGDSFVHGWGDANGGGWCERLRQHWMKTPGAPVLYQLGIRGDGLENVAKRWHQEWACRGELRRKVPDGVIIAVGINDTAKIGRPDGRPRLSAEAYRYGLMQLLKEIRGKTSLLVLGLTPVDEVVMPFAECLWYSNKDISIYESQIEETCLDLDIPFLPFHQRILDEPNWQSWIEPDGIHFNSDGHYWIYQEVSKWNQLLKWAELQPIETLTPLSQ